MNINEIRKKPKTDYRTTHKTLPTDLAVSLVKWADWTRSRLALFCSWLKFLDLYHNLWFLLDGTPSFCISEVTRYLTIVGFRVMEWPPNHPTALYLIFICGMYRGYVVRQIEDLVLHNIIVYINVLANIFNFNYQNLSF